MPNRPKRLAAPSGQGVGIRLVSNRGRSFQGSNVLGKGFILTPEQARELIQRDPRNQDVLFPYLNGEDLNSRPDCSASRWVINFHDWSEERARSYPDVFAIVERDVKPERAKNNDRRRREIWWRFTRPAMDLYNAIAELDRVLVVALVSKTVMPAQVPARQVLAHKLGVFATDQAADLALLSSTFHTAWAWRNSSTMKTDLNYSPSDIYETLPRPAPTVRMAKAGAALDMARRDIMVDKWIGLTKLYGMVHDNSVVDHAIQTLRNIHLDLDEAVAEAYGWTDLTLGYGFHVTKQGPRFTVDPSVQTEVLDRILELNHMRHVEDPAQTPLAPKPHHPYRRQATNRAPENVLF